jgi:hypothetical protein
LRVLASGFQMYEEDGVDLGTPMRRTVRLRLEELGCSVPCNWVIPTEVPEGKHPDVTAELALVHLEPLEALTFMYITKVLEEIEPKSRQPVLMCDYQCLYFPSDTSSQNPDRAYSVEQSQAVKVPVVHAVALPSKCVSISSSVLPLVSGRKKAMVMK